MITWYIDLNQKWFRLFRDWLVITPRERDQMRLESHRKRVRELEAELGLTLNDGDEGGWKP